MTVSTYVTVMDYSCDAVRSYEIVSNKALNDEAVERWLINHTNYSGSTCYYMTSFRPTTFMSYPANEGERDL